MVEPDEVEISVVHVCGHVGNVVSRCAEAYRKRYCDACAVTKLPKPSECLLRFTDEKGEAFGPMLGPIGAVVYARQSWFNAPGILAWSGTEAMHDALEGFEPTRLVRPYIELFQARGL